MDLGSIQKVNQTRIEFYEPGSRKYTHKIQVSTDSDLATAAFKDVMKNGQTIFGRDAIDYFVEEDARFVRIVNTHVDWTYWASIRELGIYYAPY